MSRPSGLKVKTHHIIEQCSMEVIMIRRFAIITVSTAAAAVFAATPALAYANPGASGRAATAPGQVVASQNCADTIGSQIQNGQTRFSNTLGVDTAVTNCDHFWNYND